MEAQSKTITGQISNIEDAISMMFNEIGQQSEGIINETLSGVSYIIEHYERFRGRILLDRCHIRSLSYCSNGSGRHERMGYCGRGVAT